MPYIGTSSTNTTDGLLAKDKDIINRTLNTMTGDNSDTTLTLSMTPASVNNVDVYLDGVRQRPTTDYTVSGTTLTFTTAPPTGVVVIAITGSAEPIGVTTESFSGSDFETITDAKIASGIASSKLTGTLPALNGSNLTSLPAANVSGDLPAISGANLTNLPAANLTGTVADARISTLTASKLTGNLPAISGASLTNLPITPAYTKSASDPVVTTNPSGGVGTVWVNQSSGEVYVCTDATSNENVWTNIGGGTGNIEPRSHEMGTNSGYASGGYTGSSQNTIDKFSFTSDGDASDIGNLTSTNRETAGQSSTTHGYVSGGHTNNTTIQKFSFSSDGDASNVSTLTTGRSGASGQSTTTYGYTTGGGWPAHDVIDKFQFSNDGNATDVGDITQSRQELAGFVSTTHGYAAGGYTSSAPNYRSDVIDKFSFSSDGNSSDVANLSKGKSGPAGQNSYNHGYATGGYANPPGAQTTDIDKFNFASNANATDVADITVARGTGSGQSSTSHGYMAGGQSPKSVSYTHLTLPTILLV